MTESATPAAPTGSETPAAATPGPVPAAPSASVFAPPPGLPAPPAAVPTPSAVPPITVVAGAPAPAATPPAASGWQWADGTLGVGEKPAWLRDDKYKSVAAQAEAYSHLEKRFGAFTGAPADGKYEFHLPDGVTGEFQPDHPLFVGFNKWAAANQLSPKGYNEVLGLFAQYEASLAPDVGAIKKQIGPDADARLTAAAQWTNANLGAEALKALFALGETPAIVQVLPLLEQAIAKTRVMTPKPGDDTTPAQPSSLDSLRNEISTTRDPSDPKKMRWNTDAAWRAEMEKKLAQQMPARRTA